jgi:hypothetical protein
MSTPLSGYCSVISREIGYQSKAEFFRKFTGIVDIPKKIFENVYREKR